MNQQISFCLHPVPPYPVFPLPGLRVCFSFLHPQILPFKLYLPFHLSVPNGRDIGPQQEMESLVLI